LPFATHARYLHHGDAELANKAFAAAQAIEPSLARPWVGQAMLSERVAPTETLDLFRHAYELSPHAQACLGFGTHVASVMFGGSGGVGVGGSGGGSDSGGGGGEKVDNAEGGRGGIPHGHERQYAEQATVALQAYCRTRHGSLDPLAHNSLGLFLHAAGLYAPAVDHFHAAARLSSNDNEQAIATRNMARSLSADGRHASAVEARRSVGDKGFTAEYDCGCAELAAGNVAEATACFQRAASFAAVARERRQALEAAGALGSCAATAGDMKQAKVSVLSSVVWGRNASDCSFYSCNANARALSTRCHGRHKAPQGPCMAGWVLRYIL
jgi:tetratricopeptide (TPR) repeat protein